jgi:hypothetical protein
MNRFLAETPGETDVTFAVNPDGAIYTLPSTAGGKRYGVQTIGATIKDCADKYFSTSDMGGCFSNVVIDGDKLVYKAYAVDDVTQKVTQIDEYAIKKNIPNEKVEGTDLPTDIGSTIDGSVGNFITEFLAMIIGYIELIPDLILGLF